MVQLFLVVNLLGFAGMPNLGPYGPNIYQGHSTRPEHHMIRPLHNSLLPSNRAPSGDGSYSCTLSTSDVRRQAPKS